MRESAALFHQRRHAADKHARPGAQTNYPIRAPGGKSEFGRRVPEPSFRALSTRVSGCERASVSLAVSAVSATGTERNEASAEATRTLQPWPEPSRNGVEWRESKAGESAPFRAGT